MVFMVLVCFVLFIALILPHTHTHKHIDLKVTLGSSIFHIFHFWLSKFKMPNLKL